MSNTNAGGGNIDFIFPRVYERELKFYSKYVSSTEVYDYLNEELRKFPDVNIFFGKIDGLIPAISGPEGEMGVIVSHKSNVLKTVFILFRVLNYGDTTMLGIYKMSNYLPPKQKYYPNNTVGCLGKTKVTYIKKLVDKWIPDLTMPQLYSGRLVHTNYEDGRDLQIGPKTVEYVKTISGCMSSRQTLQYRQENSYETTVNQVLARDELFHAFLYYTQDYMWKLVQNFVTDY